MSWYFTATWNCPSPNLPAEMTQIIGALSWWHHKPTVFWAEEQTRKQNEEICSSNGQHSKTSEPKSISGLSKFKIQSSARKTYLGHVSVSFWLMKFGKFGPFRWPGVLHLAQAFGIEPVPLFDTSWCLHQCKGLSGSRSLVKRHVTQRNWPSAGTCSSSMVRWAPATLMEGDGQRLWAGRRTDLGATSWSRRMCLFQLPTARTRAFHLYFYKLDFTHARWLTIWDKEFPNWDQSWKDQPIGQTVQVEWNNVEHLEDQLHISSIDCARTWGARTFHFIKNPVTRRRDQTLAFRCRYHFRVPTTIHNFLWPVSVWMILHVGILNPMFSGQGNGSQRSCNPGTPMQTCWSAWRRWLFEVFIGKTRKKCWPLW